MMSLWFEQALLPQGWASHVRVTIDGEAVTQVESDQPVQPHDERHAIGLPGLANLHSHAFQYAMAGLAETAGADERDNFWSWRSLMYALVARLTPEDMLAVAAMSQVEMLEAGFTRVGEFHYLHHQPDGTAYDEPAAMASAVASAAQETGIALTLLPVFYAHSDFGGKPPQPEQRRFLNDVDGFSRLVESARTAAHRLPDAVVGVAPHSLRAVTPDALTALLGIAPDSPIHIHVAEQEREVAACLAWSGQRPVAWLLDHMPVDGRWCLVHATHVEGGELAGMARQGAVVGLCPITEANLGDGIFPAADWIAAGGGFGIGSDSNVRIDAAEELRLLEYGQRLQLQRRNLLGAAGQSTGGSLFDRAMTGGAQALGIPRPVIAPGAPADIIALSADHEGIRGDQPLDRWIFTRGREAVDAVWRRGRRLVAQGRHVARDAIAARYAGTVRRLRSG